MCAAGGSTCVNGKREQDHIIDINYGTTKLKTRSRPRMLGLLVFRYAKYPQEVPISGSD